eukprot:c1321_g1_i1.p1 GENE.c1321_g1_i1~~c1321_g1_i1.p1  ORF type:complete len:287 (+),score=49.87 c1321_g1_i1:1-861(+)
MGGAHVTLLVVDMPKLSEIANADRCHCGIFGLLSFGFLISMCGLAAIPVGDIRFELQQVTSGKLNVTWPTESHRWKGEKIIVEFVSGSAEREFFENENGTLEVRAPSKEWGSYIPGLSLSFPQNYYQPINEWKVVPEEMPLMWIAPIWCFLTGILVLYGSFAGKRELLLNALVLAGVSASLVLIASHRVVELTHFCSECDSMTKHISGDGMHLGALPDGASDPDMFADNNCPASLHLKCEKGRDVYLAGGIINLICMYLLFATIEVRRHILGNRRALASFDEMVTK